MRKLIDELKNPMVNGIILVIILFSYFIINFGTLYNNVPISLVIVTCVGLINGIILKEKIDLTIINFFGISLLIIFGIMIIALIIPAPDKVSLCAEIIHVINPVFTGGVAFIEIGLIALFSLFIATPFLILGGRIEKKIGEDYLGDNKTNPAGLFNIKEKNFYFSLKKNAIRS